MNQSIERRPVVVATSGDQPELLRYAAEMADIMDAPLRVVRAQAITMGPGDLYLRQETGQILREAAQLVLDQAQEHLSTPPVVDAEYALRIEPVVFAIETESKDATLVVMGADDVAMIERLAGTDVARRTALHSHSPVMVVPAGVSHPAITKILVGLDVHNVVEDALGFAFEIADRTGADLRVITVLSPRLEAEQRTWCDGRLQGHLAHWRKAFPRVKSRAEVRLGDAADQLAAEAKDVQLVVVGHPNQPRRAPFFGKRVASSLLRTAPSTVAVVPTGNES